MNLLRPQQPNADGVVLRKMSWRILPFLGVSYGISYIDRVNISFAAAKMNEDLHFSATVYGLGAGLFFLAYALFEVPSNLILMRVGARRWIARIMLTWGCVAVAMMFVRTPLQFYFARFLLGLAEAGLFPAALVYVGTWFPAAHGAKAVSRFYVAWPLSVVAMGAIAGTLLGLNGRFGLLGWQWLFLVEGAPAILMSLVILKFLPDCPATVPWLTPEEKEWLTGRLTAEAAAKGEAGHSLFRALRDPVVLLFGAVNFIYLGSGYAFTFSAPIILGKATHLDPPHVGYLIAACAVLGAVAMLVNAWSSDRTKERYWHLAIPMLVAAALFGVVGRADQPFVVVAAYAGTVVANYAFAAAFWSAPAERLSVRAAAVGFAAINAIGQMGSFLAPYLWGVARDRTGDYNMGMHLLPLGYLLAAVLLLIAERRARTSAGIALALGT